MEEKKSSISFELICGVGIAILATLLSIIDLAGGKFGDDEIIAINEKSAAYQWYQAKSIKETAVEGERDLIKTLVESGVIVKDEVKSLEGFENKLNVKLEKYKKEKNEILKGSAKIPSSEWVQEKNGKLGELIGAEEWADKAEKLGSAGDIFDLSVLFMQVSLVLGAVALVLSNNRLKWTFFILMLTIGCVGLAYGWKAYSMASVV